MYQNIKPIGTATYPFNGIFNGNYSTLANYGVDGTGLQDIGTFGFMGPSSSVTDVYLDQPTIYSNPSSTDDTSGYHTHNDDQYNVVTGYIVGHLASGANLDNVFVVSPKIESLSSTYPNRSQFGLIGYSEADLGTIKGGPQDIGYSFDLNANNVYSALSQATTDYAGYYINGSGDRILSDALITSTSPSKLLQIQGLASGNSVPYTYSLSTLKISQTANDPDPVYLYDQMVADGNPIGSDTDGYYSRKNIDLVGLTTFGGSVGAYTFLINAYSRSLITPTSGTFDPTYYNQTMILYVKSVSDPNNLGAVTATYTGGGDLAYYKGVPGSAPTVVSFNSSGVPFTMTSSDAFCGVSLDTTTGVMTVTPDTPDYYVFLLGVTNGQTKVNDINFVYTPPTLNKDSLSTISNIDFISADELPDFDPATHTFSYINFGYDLSLTQGLDIATEKVWDNIALKYIYQITFQYSIIDSSSIYLNIINLDGYPIRLYESGNSTAIYDGNDAVIEVTMDSTNVTVIGKSS